MSEWRYAVVDLADNLTTITAVATLVKGVYINAALSAHACPIKDNTTTVVTLPASASAGTHYEFDGIRFESKLIVDPDDSATGSVMVEYNLL